VPAKSRTAPRPEKADGKLETADLLRAWLLTAAAGASPRVRRLLERLADAVEDQEQPRAKEKKPKGRSR
jgi:hypothetical protein